MPTAIDSATIDVQGVEVPKLGFGTWQLSGAQAVDGVRDALDIGYRHIDTARMYGNELEVGRAVRESGIDRGEIFLTTKVWMDDAAPGRVERAAESSLDALGLDHVDLLLLHWPSDHIPVAQTVESLERVREHAHARLVGVSNFPAALLREALEAGAVANDQVEYHPYLSQADVLAVAEAHDLFVTAYAPLAHGQVLEDVTLREIGATHGKTAGQVALRWLLDQPKVAAIPKASTPERRRENANVFDFELTDAERRTIDDLPKNRREIDPSFAPEWDG